MAPYFDLGTYTRGTSTASASAQTWFDRGLQSPRVTAVEGALALPPLPERRHGPRGRRRGPSRAAVADAQALTGSATGLRARSSASLAAR
jgi:hypothetical protein